MARITGSWLSGPNAESGGSAPGDYPGKDLGLPQEGVGSLVTMLRRITALLVDWFMALGLAAVIFRPNPDQLIAEMDIPAGQQPPPDLVVIISSLSTPTLLVWFLIGVATVTLFGYTPGQFFLKERVLRIDADAPVGFVRALVRQILLVFVVPALFTDGDGRGMHDRATGTALVRAR
ncbi:RDD family protein [Nocardia otitidiscaviarum]|uniref:RDD family protein n=1 Tax=Nocardia otitidiscaviarum TaxID=1823 RepID=UPI0004A7331F|nr:RDD family protein [Nocardia otitidiscaviarum]MBF6134820.1 RDD family protein [Nocardia otitidiscaviarum]MBF6485554.1 RDD family protein [Nocardia otitidiscaviarum]